MFRDFLNKPENYPLTSTTPPDDAKVGGELSEARAFPQLQQIIIPCLKWEPTCVHAGSVCDRQLASWPPHPGLLLRRPEGQAACVSVSVACSKLIALITQSLPTATAIAV